MKESDLMECAYSGNFPNASAKYKKLVTYIKARGPFEQYAINYSGILWRLDECEKCGRLKPVASSFGFDIDCPFFYLFKELPDMDDWDMLLKDGIDIGKLEILDDSGCLCECDVYDD